MRKHWTQPEEHMVNERLVAQGTTREGVSTHHDPVDVIRNVLEEGCAVAVLQPLKTLRTWSAAMGTWVSPLD